jgi:hypothetical protein
VDSYTEPLEDASKTLAIIVIPTRLGHIGEGCQEEPEPANKMLPLRPEELRN